MQPKHLLLLFFLLIITAAKAQLYSFKNYTTTDGLINNRTHCINQDAEGYIWIGTDNGVCRYDGKKIKYFQLPGINTFYFAPCVRRYKQYVMFSTSYGVLLCCGNTLIPFFGADKQKLNPVESLALSDSSFMFCDSRNGLYKIERDKITPMPIPFPVSDSSYPLVLQRDAYNNIWLGFSSNLVFYKGGDLNKPTILPQFKGIYINGIKEDKDRNLYILSDKGLFIVKKDQINNPLAFKLANLYPVHENIISGMAFDQTGRPWMSTQYGVVKFKNDFSSYELLNPENGIVSYHPWDAFCDRENNMWFATENGISKLNNNQVVNYKFPALEFPNIKSGCVWNDSTFIYSNGASAHILVNNKVKLINNFKDDAGYLEERLLKTPDNKLWANFNNTKVSIFPGFHTRQYTITGNNLVPDVTPGFDVNKYGYVNMESAFTDKQNNLWFSTDNGLVLYKNKRYYKYNITYKKLAVRIHAINRDGFGDLWLAAPNMLIRCNVASSADSLLVVPDIYVDETKGISKQSYTKILCDSKNRIWSGGSDGALFRVDIDSDKKIKKIYSYTTPQISSIRITDLLEYDNGDIWVGTSYGIDIISTNNNGQISIQKDAYGNELCGKNIYFLKKQNQKIYVGTTGCMAVINLAQQKLASPAPFVYINDIKTGNTQNQNFLHSKNYSLDADSNTISFYFNSPTFISDNIKYKYILEGVNTDWSQPTTDDNVTYTQLRPGKYTFKVMAQNADGTWSLNPAKKTFTILAPFYNTWWFYTLCTILVFAVVYYFYRYRLEQLKKLVRIRQNISTDLHDDIGSTLSSITMMSNVVKQKIESDPRESAKLAAQIEDTSRQMIYTMSDIVWSIKPGNDTLEQLVNRLRDYMHHMLENALDDYALITEGNIEGRNITMYMRRDIYLICKEIIHNTAKYAKAKTLVMKISTHNNILVIDAKDDGKGFDFKTVKRGNGLHNIVERVKNNKGTYACNCSPGNGTNWRIEIPL